MVEGKLLLEASGLMAEQLVSSAGNCPPFAMILSNDGENPEPITPDLLDAKGLDPHDREAYFKYIQEFVSVDDIEGLSVVVSARIKRTLDGPEEPAIIVHVEMKGTPATLFIRPYTYEDGKYDGLEPFFQDTEPRIIS